MIEDFGEKILIDRMEYLIHLHHALVDLVPMDGAGDAVEHLRVLKERTCLDLHDTTRG